MKCVENSLMQFGNKHIIVLNSCLPEYYTALLVTGSQGLF